MKNSGFTLIELVTVIIILSTLMVFVGPKVIDLQSSAKAATLQSISEAMQGAIIKLSSKPGLRA